MRKLIFVALLLAFFTIVLAAFSRPAGTTPISELREFCAYPYDGSGYIRPDCKALISQSIKLGQRPGHTIPKEDGYVRW